MSEAKPAPEALRRALKAIPGAVRVKRWLAPVPPQSPSADPTSPQAFIGALHHAYWTAPRIIETDVAPEVLDALFARTQAQWKSLGETDPHWSVLTHDDFRAERLDADALARFYQTGRDAAGLVDRFAAAAGVDAPRGVCLELGCGVGRVTAPLAERYERVVGVDISPGNLAEARAHLDREGVGNVDLVLLDSVRAVADLPDFDVLFTIIVLQHNSPPVQAFILDQLLAKVRPGGAVLFQTATDIAGYGFVAADELATPDRVMDIHALPQPAILRLLRRHGLETLQVMADPWLGVYGSNTFFAVKPA